MLSKFSDFQKNPFFEACSFLMESLLYAIDGGRKASQNGYMEQLCVHQENAFLMSECGPEIFANSLPPWFPAESEVAAKTPAAFLPAVLSPVTTDSVQMSSKDDVEKFLVADAREIQEPMESNMARRAVLNALRTIVPSRGVFLVAGYVVHLVIYDFYYHGTQLRMIIILLETLEVFDAFAFQEDWMHMLRSCSRIIVPSKSSIAWKDWNKVPGFSYFYIKCQQLNKFQSLDKAICSAAKSMKFNQSLKSWITGSTRSFLSACEIKCIPSKWEPLNQSVALHLFSSAQLSSLTENNVCTTKMLTKIPCPCDLAKEEYMDDLKTGKVHGFWDVKQLLRFTPTAAHWKLQKLVQPCVMTIQSLKINYEQIAACAVPTMEEEKSEAATCVKDEHISNDTGVRCLWGITCHKPASCYWVECCNPMEPVMCEYHAAKQLRKKKAFGLSKCPKHRISGLSVRILK
jgi:hypothetical protein